jgi:predicted amidophosphoribosyltransferase
VPLDVRTLLQSHLARWARSSDRALRDLTGLLLPVECPGCGAWDVELCPACAGLLTGTLRRCEAGAPALAGSSAALPVWSVAPYGGAVRGVVLAWKGDGGRRRRLARAVGRAGRAAGAELAGALVAVTGHPVAGDLVVVPAPSGWRRRARGRLVVRDLARDVAAGLADAGLAASGRCVVLDALRRRAGRAHQSGLGASGRRANRRGSMHLTGRIPPGSVCVLVDDVVTTGATLEECRRALTQAGHEVLGALVLAATPGRPAAS